VVGSQQRQAFCGQLFGLIIGLSGLARACPKGGGPPRGWRGWR